MQLETNTEPAQALDLKTHITVRFSSQKNRGMLGWMIRPTSQPGSAPSVFSPIIRRDISKDNYKILKFNEAI